MSPRTRGFQDVPSPHDKSHPPNYGGKVRPLGAPPPQRVTSLPPAPERRGSPALPLVLAIVALGVLAALIAFFAQRSAPTRPTETHTVIEVPQ